MREILQRDLFRVAVFTHHKGPSCLLIVGVALGGASNWRCMLGDARHAFARIEATAYGVSPDQTRSWQFERVLRAARRVVRARESRRRASMRTSCSSDTSWSRSRLARRCASARCCARTRRCSTSAPARDFRASVLKIAWPAIQLTLHGGDGEEDGVPVGARRGAGLDETPVLHRPRRDAGARPGAARAVRPGGGAGGGAAARAAGADAAVRARRRARRRRRRARAPTAELAAAANALAVLGGQAFSCRFAVPGPPQTLVVGGEAARDARRVSAPAGGAAKSPL